MGLFAFGGGLTDSFFRGKLLGKSLIQAFVGHADGGHGSRLTHGSSQPRGVGGEAVEGNAIKGAFIG